MSAIRKGSRVDCPFCEAKVAIENVDEDQCWSCERQIVYDGDLLDEQDIMGRPEDNL